jgi:hypothetical protein
VPAAAAPPLLGSTGSTTVVLAALLAVLGLVMLGAAVWLVRATRTDTRALGPLEVMGDRSFRRRDPEARAALLAGARPQGAADPFPMLEDEPQPEADPEADPDADADAGSDVAAPDNAAPAANRDPADGEDAAGDDEPAGTAPRAN